MNENFDKCMSMLLEHEGGYVNHPSDPGGMTNLGVTKRTYDEFHGTDIDEEGMRNLTVEDVTPIYRGTTGSDAVARICLVVWTGPLWIGLLTQELDAPQRRYSELWGLMRTVQSGLRPLCWCRITSRRI